MVPFRLNGPRNTIVLVTTFIRCLSGSLWSGLSISPKSQNHSSTTLAAQTAFMTDARSGFLHSVSQLTGCLVAIGIFFIDCLILSVHQAAGSHKTLSQVTTVIAMTGKTTLLCGSLIVVCWSAAILAVYSTYVHALASSKAAMHQVQDMTQTALSQVYDLYQFVSKLPTAVHTVKQDFRSGLGRVVNSVLLMAHQLRSSLLYTLEQASAIMQMLSPVMAWRRVYSAGSHKVSAAAHTVNGVMSALKGPREIATLLLSTLSTAQKSLASYWLLQLVQAFVSGSCSLKGACLLIMHHSTPTIVLYTLSWFGIDLESSAAEVQLVMDKQASDFNQQASVHEDMSDATSSTWSSGQDQTLSPSAKSSTSSFSSPFKSSSASQGSLSTGEHDSPSQSQGSSQVSPSRKELASPSDVSKPSSPRQIPSKAGGVPQNLEQVLYTSKDVGIPQAESRQDPNTHMAEPIQDPNTSMAEPSQDPDTSKAEPSQDPNISKAEPSQHVGQVMGGGHTGKTSLSSQASAEPAQAVPAPSNPIPINATAGFNATAAVATDEAGPSGDAVQKHTAKGPLLAPTSSQPRQQAAPSKQTSKTPLLSKVQANERGEMCKLLAAPENAAPDAVIPEGEWKDCIFNTSEAGYRQPKRPSFLGNGQTACVFWAERVRGPEGPLAKPVRVAIKQVTAPVNELIRLDVQREHDAMQALAGKAFVTPMYSMHLPPAGDQSAHAYIAMGLAKGKDVQHICECVHKAAQQLQGPELDALKAWAWQFGMHVTLFMVQAMTKMHEAGYYHRDIKPQNLVVSGFDGKNLCGKVIDWACARQYDELGQPGSGATSAYCSSERLRCFLEEKGIESGDKLNDIWALGVSVHRILTCTNADWHLAFPVLVEGSQAFAKLHPDLQQVAVHQAVLKQHKPWKAAHRAMNSAEKSTFQRPESASLFADIHKACTFTASRHDAAAEAANVCELLYWVLHPDSQQRLDALQLSRKGGRVPWLWAHVGSKMDRCPVGI